MIAAPLWLALAVATTTPAAVPPAAPDAETLASARALMRVADIKVQMHALGPRLGASMLRAMEAEFVDHKIPVDLSQRLSAAMQTFMGSMDTAFTPAVIDQLATIYARHFSKSELDRLTVMLADPAMQRFRTEMPSVLADEMPILLAAMRPQQAAFEAAVKQIVADWIRDHPDEKSRLVHPNAS